MNEQLIKLAEKLNKGVDNIPVMYESLRSQYIVYHIADVLSSFFGTIAGVGLGVGIFMMIIDTCGDMRDDLTSIRRMNKILLTVGAIALLITVGCRFALYMYAPDIVMLDGFRK